MFRKLKKAQSISDLEQHLTGFLSDACTVEEDEHGDLFIANQRHLVDSIGAIRIELYSNEHAPPHFHLKGGGIDASFTISDCQPLKGTVPNKVLKKIRMWHSHAQVKLVELWNETRPSGCTVGRIET